MAQRIVNINKEIKEAKDIIANLAIQSQGNADAAIALNKKQGRFMILAVLASGLMSMTGAIMAAHLSSM